MSPILLKVTVHIADGWYHLHSRNILMAYPGHTWKAGPGKNSWLWKNKNNFRTEIFKSVHIVFEASEKTTTQYSLENLKVEWGTWPLNKLRNMAFCLNYLSVFSAKDDKKLDKLRDTATAFWREKNCWLCDNVWPLIALRKKRAYNCYNRNILG